MDTETSKRFEVNEWKVGTVQEFLELSDDEALQVEQELELWLKKNNRLKPIQSLCTNDNRH